MVVALIGAGNMGLAMLEGWAKEGLSGGDVVVVEPNPSQRLSDLCAVKGFRVAAQPAAGSARDAVILAVKPQALDAGAASAAPFVGPGSVVVSILAGKRIADLSARLPAAKAIVRAMPNTPAAIGRGMTGAFANSETTEPQRALADALLKAAGQVEWVESEALIDAVTAGKKILVVGSSWPEDEEVLLPALFRLTKEMPDLITVLVPHEPTETHLEELERELNGSLTHIRFSELGEYNGEQVVVVDSIGVLLRLYAHAHVAYIGGSFRQGIHNVLEAAVYGIPVIFGPKHRNSQEPLQMAERGGAFVVSDEGEMERTLRSLLGNEAARARAGAAAAGFVEANTGATARFLARLAPRLRLAQLAPAAEEKH